MNAIRIISILGIAIGAASTVLEVSLKRGDTLASSHSFGYLTLYLGLISLILDLCGTRRRRALALMGLGMFLVILGEKIPALFITALTEPAGRSRFLDIAGGHLAFGVACVVFSWVILVIDTDKNEKKN